MFADFKKAELDYIKEQQQPRMSNAWCYGIQQDHSLSCSQAEAKASVPLTPGQETLPFLMWGQGQTRTNWVNLQSAYTQMQMRSRLGFGTSETSYMAARRHFSKLARYVR